jgi:hypothetical protein
MLPVEPIRPRQLVALDMEPPSSLPPADSALGPEIAVTGTAPGPLSDGDQEGTVWRGEVGAVAARKLPGSRHGRSREGAPSSSCASNMNRLSGSSGRTLLLLYLWMTPDEAVLLWRLRVPVAVRSSPEVRVVKVRSRWPDDRRLSRAHVSPTADSTSAVLGSSAESTRFSQARVVLLPPFCQAEASRVPRTWGRDEGSEG